MQVQIMRGKALARVSLALTEEDAMRRIKDEYPDAVSVAWEADCDRLDLRGQPKGQRKLVYENQGTLGRKSRLVARIRKYA
jgi:hypothetical protein